MLAGQRPKPLTQSGSLLRPNRLAIRLRPRDPEEPARPLSRQAVLVWGQDHRVASGRRRYQFFPGALSAPRPAVPAAGGSRPPADPAAKSGPWRHDANRKSTSFSPRRRRVAVRRLAEDQPLDTAMPEPGAVRGRRGGDGLPLPTPIASRGCRHLRPITAKSAHPTPVQPQPRSDTPDDRGGPDLESSLWGRGSAVVRIARTGASDRSSGGGWARAPARGSRSGAAAGWP